MALEQRDLVVEGFKPADLGVRYPSGTTHHVRNQSGGRISTDLTTSGGPSIQPRMRRKNSDEMISRVRFPARRGFLFSVTLGRRDRQVVLRLRVGQREMFLCRRIRENSVRFRGRHSTSHESGDSQHTPLTVYLKCILMLTPCSRV